ncbi:MAG: hypothetical protein JKY65_03185 [Planctomycetes bacterium]|nr:hypothetical protein [Planctomycetota bacterium]
MTELMTRALAALLLLAIPMATPGLAMEEDVASIPAFVEGESKRIWRNNYGGGITIRGTEDYITKTRAVLDQLKQLPTGSKTLAALASESAEGRSLVIEMLPPKYQANGAVAFWDYATPTERYTQAVSFRTSSDSTSPMRGSSPPIRPDELDALARGAGAKAGTVMLDPDLKIEGFVAPVLMGHELLHILHYFKGERLPNLQNRADGTGQTRQEENRVIGTRGFAGEKLTENRMRGDWNELHPEQQIPGSRASHASEDFGPPTDFAGNPITPQAAPQGGGPRRLNGMTRVLEEGLVNPVEAR